MTQFFTENHILQVDGIEISSGWSSASVDDLQQPVTYENGNDAFVDYPVNYLWTNINITVIAGSGTERLFDTYWLRQNGRGKAPFNITFTDKIKIDEDNEPRITSYTCAGLFKKVLPTHGTPQNIDAEATCQYIARVQLNV